MRGFIDARATGNEPEAAGRGRRELLAGRGAVEREVAPRDDLGARPGAQPLCLRPSVEGLERDVDVLETPRRRPPCTRRTTRPPGASRGSRSRPAAVWSDVAGVPRLRSRDPDDSRHESGVYQTGDTYGGLSRQRLMHVSDEIPACLTGRAVSPAGCARDACRSSCPTRQQNIAICSVFPYPLISRPDPARDRRETGGRLRLVWQQKAQSCRLF